MENILEIRNLVTSFASDGRRDRAVAVNGVDLDIPRGKTVGLVGESGCGKSVTSLSVMGLLAENGRVDSGTAMFGGRDLLKLPDRELRRIRGNRISMIFQEPMTSLNPVITVGKQVAEAVMLHTGADRRDAKAKAIEILEKVGIPEPERRFASYPHQLSGGLRQRVMIGMAMILKPDLLIADEPTTALDVSIEAQILRLMRDLQRESGTSILMITHNLGVVAELCDTDGLPAPHDPQGPAAVQHPGHRAQPAGHARGLPVLPPVRVRHRVLPDGKARPGGHGRRPPVPVPCAPQGRAADGR